MNPATPKAGAASVPTAPRPASATAWTASPSASWRSAVPLCGIRRPAEAGRDAVASLYPTAEEARITCAIVDAAAKVRDLNFKYMAEGKGATVTARFGKDGITICDPNSPQVFQRIYEKPI